MFVTKAAKAAGQTLVQLVCISKEMRTGLDHFIYQERALLRLNSEINFTLRVRTALMM